MVCKIETADIARARRINNFKRPLNFPLWIQIELVNVGGVDVVEMVLSEAVETRFGN